MKQKYLLFSFTAALGVLFIGTVPARADSVDDYMNRNVVNTANELKDQLDTATVVHCTMGGETQTPAAPNTTAFDVALNQPTRAAVQPQIGIGLTKYSLIGNGTWYQEGFPYRANLVNQNISIGVDAKITDAVSVRAGFEDLGQVSSHAKASASDANYAACKNDHSKCWPMSTWLGDGGVRQQVYATVDGEQKLFGITFIGEAGMVIYKPTWTETIPDWISSPTATPQLVQVSHTPKLIATTILGAGVRLDKRTTLMFNWEKTPASGDQYPAIYSGSTYSVQLRRDFQ